MCNFEEIGGSESMEASVGVCNFGEMEGKWSSVLMEARECGVCVCV